MAKTRHVAAFAPMRSLAGAAALLIAGAALVAGMVVLLVASSSPARAHSGLVSSTPADGATVAVAPSVTTLVFNEEINPQFAQAVVVAPDGRMESPAPAVAGPKVTVPMPTGLGSGTVVVRYRVVSSDSHPVDGEISFTVATASSPNSATSPASASGSTPAAPTGQATTGGTVAGTSGVKPTHTVSDEGTNIVPYLLTGTGALILVGFGLLIVHWERQRQGR